MKGNLRILGTLWFSGSKPGLVQGKKRSGEWLKSLFATVILLCVSIALFAQGGYYISGNKHSVNQKVIDNGEGIEASKLPNIFDMFYRATERSEGSGLGLYIVKKVADKLDARIEVDSVELEGTTFTVTIPNSRIK